MNPNPWPYAYIRSLAEEATIRAEQKGLRPATTREVLSNWKQSKRFNVPFLGDYVPQGWEIVSEVAAFFVDCTGHARPGRGNAITRFEFFKRVEAWAKEEKPYAFGVIEVGQTQALVQVYQKA